MLRLRFKWERVRGIEFHVTLKGNIEIARASTRWVGRYEMLSWNHDSCPLWVIAAGVKWEINIEVQILF